MSGVQVYEGDGVRGKHVVPGMELQCMRMRYEKESRQLTLGKLAGPSHSIVVDWQEKAFEGYEVSVIGLSIIYLPDSYTGPVTTKPAPWQTKDFGWVSVGKIALLTDICRAPAGALQISPLWRLTYERDCTC